MALVQMQNVPLTQADEERFLQNRAAHGLQENTLRRYRGDLDMLRAYLGPQAQIGPQTLLNWQTEMLRTGYAVRTVTARLATANNYLTFCGRPDLRHVPPPDPRGPVPALTQAEYNSLLQTAKLRGNRRAELLVRLFGEYGLRLHQLARVTVEAVTIGKIPAGNHLQRLDLRLQWELLLYARDQGIRSGPVFMGGGGAPLSRTSVATELRNLARAAGVPAIKEVTRSLQAYHRQVTAHSGAPPESAGAVPEQPAAGA